jgi:hypothetical protein
MSTPLRTQYAFDLSGVRFRSRGEILTMQRQWETFERIENYNDVIYQSFSVGDRSKPYYQFKDQAEINDYRVGRILHERRYPTLPDTTFASISNRPMPDVPVVNATPVYSYLPPRDIPQRAAPPEGQTTTAESDMTIYFHVSTFNATHHFQYNFVSDDERLAYHRAERLVRMGLSP